MESITKYKIYSVLLAIAMGSVNSLQTIQTKFMVKRENFGIGNIQADGGLMFGFLCGILTIYNFLTNNESLTINNILISFIVSSLLMIAVFVAQNCTVKGVAGPTIAIIYSQSLFCTILQVVFQGLVPSIF